MLGVLIDSYCDESKPDVKAYIAALIWETLFLRLDVLEMETWSIMSPSLASTNKTIQSVSIISVIRLLLHDKPPLFMQLYVSMVRIQS
jgi:hypothetical protein